MSDNLLLERFSSALRGGLLEMRFQPKIRLRDGLLISVEALMRWTDPELGRIDPPQFVALAERNGLIGELTEFGLGKTLEQWLIWRRQGLDIRVAFNISAMSLEHLDFPDFVEAMCKDAGVPTHRVVVELTESATQPLIMLMDTLTRFRIKGFGLAIDDFGTGYSSMMQLHQLPFTEVKIDRSFVIDATRAADSRLIVKTIVDLAHGLDLVVTAEGIEEPQQVELLRELGCDMAQGYLISKPLHSDDVAPWKRKFEAGWKDALHSDNLELWGNVGADPPR